MSMSHPLLSVGRPPDTPWLSSSATHRRTCHAYAKVLGVDPTNGLQETASWATRSGKLSDISMPPVFGYPKWMAVPMHDEVCSTTCEYWTVFSIHMQWSLTLATVARRIAAEPGLHPLATPTW